MFMPLRSELIAYNRSMVATAYVIGNVSVQN